MPLAAGRRLGPYEVISCLGAGGMGEVYRARDSRLGRDVALKVLPPDSSRDPDRVRRFEQEARAVAALDHPHILTLHDVGSEDELSYVVFELLDGETLRQRLESGPVPVRKSVEWGVQICRGLAAAHARGIVHRDLKPENLSLTAEGRIKILDFGLAKAMPSRDVAGLEHAQTRTATESGFVIGTVGYMSPEQVRGQAADARSDIFSLGAVLFEMLTGRRAFDAATPADTILAILHHDPSEIRSDAGPVPPGLDRVVRRCLEKDPDERFQTARDLAFALENQTGSSTSGTAVAAPHARARRLGIAAGLLLLPLAAAGALYLGARRRPPLPDFSQVTLRRGMILEARFTADGNTVAYSGLFDGSPAETYVMRLDQPGSLRLDLPAARLVGVSSAGELAVVLTEPGYRGFSSTGTLARVPLSGGVPREILADVWWADWSPDGRDLAVLRIVDGAAQLEYPIGRVLARPVPFYTAGFGLRVSPRGDRIALKGTKPGVRIVDRAGTILDLATNLGAVRGLAWDPSADAVWVVGRGAASSMGLWRVGLDGSVREAARLPGSVMIHDVSRDGRMLVHVGFERLGVRARAPDEASERDLCPFSFCAAPHLTDDGRHLLVGDTSEMEAGRTQSAVLYSRPTSGGPPLRLGEGWPMGLSQDGSGVLSAREAPRMALELVPLAAGTSKALNAQGLEHIEAGWFLDASHFLLMGSGPDGRRRTYRGDLGGTKPIPLTPEGVVAIEGSFVGDSVLAVANDGTLAWYPLSGGEPRSIPARRPAGTWVIRMSADKRFLFLGEPGVPGRIDRLELATGQRLPWRTLLPDDDAGVVETLAWAVTPDGSAYAYSYLRFFQDLYLVQGVR